MTTAAPRRLESLDISAPSLADARAWTDFVITEQARTYQGLVPADFAERSREWSDADALAASFAETADRHLLARHDGCIVGVASCVDGPSSWEVDAGLLPAPAGRELQRLYVAPDWHGTGLGHVLLTSVTDELPCYLWLIDGNDRAAAFYQRHGFEHLDETFPAGGSWGRVPMHRMVRRS